MMERRFDLIDMDTGIHLTDGLAAGDELLDEMARYEAAGWEVHAIDAYGYYGSLSLDREDLYNTGHPEDWLKLHKLRKQNRYPMCKLIGRRFTRNGFSGNWRRVTEPLLIPEPNKLNL